jgi:hypothetical protein
MRVFILLLCKRIRRVGDLTRLIDGHSLSRLQQDLQ